MVSFSDQDGKQGIYSCWLNIYLPFYRPFTKLFSGLHGKTCIHSSLMNKFTYDTEYSEQRKVQLFRYVYVAMKKNVFLFL